MTPEKGIIVVSGSQSSQVDEFVFSSTMLVHRYGEPAEFITEVWPLEQGISERYIP